MSFTAKVITTIIAASALFSLRVEAQVADYGSGYGILSFESGIENVHAGKGSSLGISSEHNKLGHRSLLWEWNRSKAAISIKEDIPYLPENPNPKERSVSHSSREERNVATSPTD